MSFFTLRPKQAGFTLIELLVAMSILLLAVSMMPLALDRLLPARRVLITSRELSLALRQMRAEASQTGRPVRLSIEASAYSIHRPEQQEPKRVDIAPLTLSMKSTNGANARELVIFPDGTSSGAEIEVADADRRKRISIGLLTGRVTVSDAL